MQDPDFYRHHAIIPQPQESKDEIYCYRYVLDSRLRDRISYPNSHTFTLKLDEPFRKVHSINLTTLNFQMTKRYLIHSKNNQIQIDGGAIQTIAEGDYELGTLNTVPTTLLSAIDTISGGTGSAFGPVDDRTVLGGLTANTTVVKFPSTQNGNSLAYILGFLPDTDYTADGSGNITSTHRANINKPEYCVLNLSNVELNRSQTSSKLNESFAIVSSCREVADYHEKVPMIRVYRSPLDYFDRFEVKLTDYYGDACDLNGTDFMAEFIIKTKRIL